MRNTGGREASYSSKTDRVNMSGQGRRQKKRRRDAYLVAGIFAMVVAVAVLCFVFLFKLQTIEVINDAQRYSDGMIEAASGLKAGDSLMGVNRKSVSRLLEETLPYIGTAVVRIKYPDTVVIGVEYTKAKLAVERDDGYVLLDINGKVLETGVRMLGDYVAVITGAQLSEAVPGKKAVFTEETVLGTVTRLAKAFEENGIVGVTAYDLTDMLSIVAEVNYNTDIKLGTGAKAVEQLRFGREVIERTLNQAKSALSKLVIDLTEDGSAYVRTQENIDAAKKAAEEALTADAVSENEDGGGETSSPDESVTEENVPTEAPETDAQESTDGQNAQEESEAVG